MKTNLNVTDVARYNYNEAEALQQLLLAIDDALLDSIERTEQHDDMTGQFTINIGGQSIAFILGGPQTTALHEFVKSIAGENFYDVDFEQLTVR